MLGDAIQRIAYWGGGAIFALLVIGVLAITFARESGHLPRWLLPVANSINLPWLLGVMPWAIVFTIALYLFGSFLSANGR